MLKDHRGTLQRRHVDEEEVAGSGYVQVVHEVEVAVHAWWEAVAERHFGGARKEQRTPIDVVDADPRSEDAGIAVPGHPHAASVVLAHHWSLYRHIPVIAIVQRGVLGLVDVEGLIGIAVRDACTGNGEIVGQGSRSVPSCCEVFDPIRSVGGGLVGNERIAQQIVRRRANRWETQGLLN